MYALLFTVVVLPALAFAEDSEASVCVAVLIRNKEHSLPYFLGALERLNYPKGKIALWIVMDHSVDKSQDILDKWVPRVQSQYKQVSFSSFPDPVSYPTQSSDVDWPEERMDRIIALKTAALSFARELSSDYLFYIDADAILINRESLKLLISRNKPIIAPMLNSTGFYSNFWCGMDERGYYKRTDDYRPIRHRHLEGVFEVPMIHSAVLIDLRKQNSENLSFKVDLFPNAPHDDIIIFAFSAKANGLAMFVDNSEFYGYIPVPRETDQTLEDEVVHWRELVTSKAVVKQLELIPEPFDYDVTETNKLGFDEIYMVNLLRRTDRFMTMKRIFRLFNMGFRHFAAADGQQFNSSYLSDLGVKMLDGYLDPYHQRPLKMGEVGCFLSHYFIWEDMVKNNYQRILILEDDAWLEPHFCTDLPAAVTDADNLVPGWELMYVGRKVIDWNDERYVEGSSRLLYPGYSYWTVGYALTLSGAKKFLAQNPLSKMVAVDEFLPIMFDKNSHSEWSMQFSERNVVALSVNPLLVHPLLYTHEVGHYSDTEASVTIEPILQETPTFHSLKSVPETRGEMHGEL